MNTKRARIEALLTQVLGDNKWMLYTSENGGDDWLDPVALTVNYEVPFEHVGYGLCDAASGNPTDQAAFLLAQTIEGMYSDYTACAAVASYAVDIAAHQIAERN